MTEAVAAALGCVYSDRRQIIVEVDDTFLEIVRRERHELIGRPSLFCTYDPDLALNKPLLDGLSREGVAFAITKRYVCGDGAIVWVHNHVAFVRPTIGDPLICATSSVRERPFGSAHLSRNYRRARQICGAFASARVGSTAGLMAAPVVEAMVWLYRAEVEGRIVTVETLAADVGSTTRGMVRWATLMRERGLIEADEAALVPDSVLRIAPLYERKLDGILSQLAG